MNYVGNLKRIFRLRLGSLFTKYFLLVASLAIVLVSVANIIYYGYYKNLLTVEIENSNLNTGEKVCSISDMIFNETNTMLAQISYDGELLALVNYSPLMFPDYNSIYRYSTIVSSFFSKTLTSEYIDSIEVYSIPNDYVFSSIAGGNQRIYYRDPSWIQPALDRMNNATFYAEKRVSFDKTYISCYSYLPLTRKEKLGIICANIDAERMKNIITFVNNNHFDRIIMIDETNQIILNSSYDNDDAFYKAAVNELDQSKTDTAILRFEGNDYAVSVIPSKFTSFRYLMATSIRTYSKKLLGLNNFMYVSMLIGIVFAVFSATLTSRQFYKPIKGIRQMFDKASNLTDEYRSKYKDEYQYILDSIENSFKRSDDITRDLAYRIELLDKAKTAALQAHINPHFLCNTLETVNFMAMRHLNGDNEISQMVVSLSNLLRQSLQTENVFTTLMEEISNSKEYINILSVRYKDRFDVIWNIQKECNACRVINIMIQPLLENAIYHGIKPASQKCTIIVTAKMEGDLLIIMVSDNGVGMEEIEIDTLNRNLRSEYIQKNEHIGLMNVNQRIKLLFGENYGLLIEKNIGLPGVTGKIILPVIIVGIDQAS